MTVVCQSVQDKNNPNFLFRPLQGKTNASKTAGTTEIPRSPVFGLSERVVSVHMRGHVRNTLHRTFPYWRLSSDSV